MSFLRHARSIGPMGAQTFLRLGLCGASRWSASNAVVRRGCDTAPSLIVRDESHRLFLGGLVSTRARLRFTGCVHLAMKESRRSRDFHRTANSGLTGCLSRGVRLKSTPGCSG